MLDEGLQSNGQTLSQQDVYPLMRTELFNIYIYHCSVMRTQLFALANYQAIYDIAKFQSLHVK